VSYLAPAKISMATPAFSSSTPCATPAELTFPKRKPNAPKSFHSFALAAAFILFYFGSAGAQAQTATVNWTNVHQIIDGFGASNVYHSASMSSANQQFFFGTGSGQLGLSILRVAVPNNGDSGGFGISCATVSTACAGQVVGDMQAAVAAGARIYATPFSPPPIYTTNGSTVCTAGSGNGALNPSDYALYATWLSNFVQSAQAQGVPIYALSIQNEANGCWASDSAVYSSSQLVSFIKNNLGPTFASNGISTLIFAPETNVFSDLQNLGGGCATDSACAAYVGGFNFHDYDASLNGYAVNADPYPSSWPAKKYWQSEVSCFVSNGSPAGPNFCPNTGFNGGMAAALKWAALIDQRIAVDGVDAWLYWWLISKNSDDEGLIASDGVTVAARAYVLAQYSKFVRPGYYRIDATHTPQSGVSVSAYQNKSTNTVVIIATNYTGSTVSQTFNLTNAPNFSTVTPTITSASLNLAAQSSVAVTGNSFTYTLPANSITTFVGTASTPPAPTNLSGTVVQ
jgi:glucuronoarabinoxylan endo-1,4-beta-xylanase